jgi:hypothetical protein
VTDHIDPEDNGAWSGFDAPATETFSEALARVSERRMGQLGYSAPWAAVQGLQIIYFSLPSYLARAWTINLLAMRYSGGAVGIGADGSFVPNPDASIVNSVGSQQQSNVIAHLEYGVDGATEHVDMDYPWAGVSFEILASTVKLVLQCPTDIMVGNPTLGAFAVPSNRVGNLSTSPPVRTISAGINVEANPFRQVFIPARAAYYTVAIDNPSIGGGFTPRGWSVYQADFTGFTVYRYDVIPSALEDPNSIEVYEDFSGGRFRFPIHPAATSLMLVSDSGSSYTVIFRFELDLG